MALFDKNFKEIFSFQIISLIGGMIAGTILAVYTDRLLLAPGMLILLPGFLEMRGNISGSMAARLTCGLFLGFIKTKKTKSKIVRDNMLASFLLAIVVSFALGLMAFAFNIIFFGIFIPKIIIIPLLAGIIANAVEINLTLFFTFYLFNKGHNPDNVIGPFLTTTGDITSIVSLLIVMVMI